MYGKTYLPMTPWTRIWSPKTICWRGYFCSILCFFPLCQILIDCRDLGLFLGSLFCSIGLCACSYAIKTNNKQINKEMLERMWRKGNPGTLLVGMQTGAATVENSMEFVQKTKNGTAFWPSNSVAGLYPKTLKHQSIRTCAPQCS